MKVNTIHTETHACTHRETDKEREGEIQRTPTKFKEVLYNKNQTGS